MSAPAPTVALQLQVSQARRIDAQGACYVKVKHQGRKYKTADAMVQSGERWNDSFRLTVPASGIEPLCIEVYESCDFSGNELIGKARLAIDGWEVGTGSEGWIPLSKEREVGMPHNAGQIHVKYIVCPM